MDSTNNLVLDGKSESELVSSIKETIERINTPKKTEPIRQYHLEIIYHEILLTGERKAYKVRKQINAHNLKEARNTLYERVLDSCYGALIRKDILSYDVRQSTIKPYNPNS